MEGAARWQAVLQPLGSVCRGRAPPAGGDTGLAATMAPACQQSCLPWTRDAHGRVPVPRADSFRSKASSVSEVQRGVVFHCIEGETEAQSGEGACLKSAAMVGGEHATAAVPAGGWVLSHTGGSWHMGYWPWPLAPWCQKTTATRGRWSWVLVAQIPVAGSTAESWEGKAELPLTPVPAGPRWQQGSAVPKPGLTASQLPALPPAYSTQQLYSKAKRGVTALQRGRKTKTNRSMFFFALPAQLPAPPLSSPLECAFEFLAGLLRAAAGFASDCLQRLRFSHTPDHG